MKKQILLSINDSIYGEDDFRVVIPLKTRKEIEEEIEVLSEDFSGYEIIDELVDRGFIKDVDFFESWAIDI